MCSWPPVDVDVPRLCVLSTMSMYVYIYIYEIIHINICVYIFIHVISWRWIVRAFVVKASRVVEEAVTTLTEAIGGG